MTATYAVDLGRLHEGDFFTLGGEVIGCNDGYIISCRGLHLRSAKEAFDAYNSGALEIKSDTAGGDPVRHIFQYVGKIRPVNNKNLVEWVNESRSL